jgi:hypothetical protein
MKNNKNNIKKIIFLNYNKKIKKINKKYKKNLIINK